MVDLFAAKGCWEFKKKHPEEFENYGCGPGGVGDFLVPDTVWGLSIRNACRIHDWGYRHDSEASEENRAMHDRALRNNALRIVQAKTRWGWVKMLRRIRVQTYYGMVRSFGGPAYWDERNKADEIGRVD